jgi:3-hydroxyisobutyrate dehydrogenase
LPGARRGPESPADNDYKPGFAADLMLKDLRLSQEAAEGVDADTPMGAWRWSFIARFVEEEDGAAAIFRDAAAVRAAVAALGRGQFRLNL